MNRGLLVGINTYNENQMSSLRGCVNDVQAMANLLTQKCQFKASDIRLVTDKRATATALRERLKWLVDDAKPGDRLFFYYSGHGAQVATRSPQSEVDGLDEVICPADFDWNNNTSMIRDQEFKKLFSGIPKGVEFLWVSDSCHSGDLSPNFIRASKSKSKKSKTVAPPVDLDWRLRIAAEKNIKALSMNGSAKGLNVALMSACKSNQISADNSFQGTYHGAFTYYLLRELKKPIGLASDLPTLIKKVMAALKKERYAQEPQLEGSEEIINGSFLK
jgi:metacaspase-1